VQILYGLLCNRHLYLRYVCCSCTYEGFSADQRESLTYISTAMETEAQAMPSVISLLLSTTGLPSSAVRERVDNEASVSGAKVVVQDVATVGISSHERCNEQRTFEAERVSFSVTAGSVKNADTITNAIKLAGIYLPIFANQDLNETQTTGLRDHLAFLDKEFDKSQAKKVAQADAVCTSKPLSVWKLSKLVPQAVATAVAPSKAPGPNCYTKAKNSALVPSSLVSSINAGSFKQVHFKPASSGRAESLTDFWQRNNDNSKYILANAVKDSSQSTYSVGWKALCLFASTHAFCPFLQTPSIEWLAVTSVTVPRRPFDVCAIMAFMTDLFFVKEMRPTSIVNYLSGIRHVLRTYGYSLDAFSSATIAAYRSSLNLLYRAKHPIADERRLPVSCDMILVAISTLFNMLTSEHSCIRTAMVLAFCCLLRVSEYIGKYRVRCGDIRFSVLLKSDKIVVLSADQIQSNLALILRPIDVHINVRYSKTDSFGDGHSYFFKAGVKQIGSFDIVQVLFDHASLTSGSVNSTSFLQITGRFEYTLSYAKFAEAIKKLAVHFQLPPERFATHSFRIGGACALLASGESEALIRLMGHWKSLAFLDYLRITDNAFEIAITAITNPNSMTVDHIRRLVRERPAASLAPEASNVEDPDATDDEVNE
jgi:hypothetical protein